MKLLRFNQVEISVPEYYLEERFQLRAFMEFATNWWQDEKNVQRVGDLSLSPSCIDSPSNIPVWSMIYEDFEKLIEDEYAFIFIKSLKNEINQLPPSDFCFTIQSSREVLIPCLLNADLETLTSSHKLNDVFNWEDELYENFTLSLTNIPQSSILVLNRVLEQVCECAMDLSEAIVKEVENSENGDEYPRYGELGNRLPEELLTVLPPKLQAFLSENDYKYSLVLWELSFNALPATTELL